MGTYYHGYCSHPECQSKGDNFSEFSNKRHWENILRLLKVLPAVKALTESGLDFNLGFYSLDRTDGVEDFALAHADHLELVFVVDEYGAQVTLPGQFDDFELDIRPPVEGIPLSDLLKNNL